MISILKNKDISEFEVDMIENPKTTTINTFELYYGARNSVNPEKSLSEVNSMLKSIDIIAFDNRAARKAGEIQVELINIGRPVNILDTLIAGIVITNNEEIVTRDISHFSRIKGLRCRSW